MVALVSLAQAFQPPVVNSASCELVALEPPLDGYEATRERRPAKPISGTSLGIAHARFEGGHELTASPGLYVLHDPSMWRCCHWPLDHRPVVLLTRSHAERLQQSRCREQDGGVEPIWVTGQRHLAASSLFLHISTKLTFRGSHGTGLVSPGLRITRMGVRAGLARTLQEGTLAG